MSEANISPLFSHKYQIIKFMDSNKLASFVSNTNVKDEHYLFCQLSKVVDSIEYNAEHSIANNSNDNDKSNSDSDSESIHDPMDDIDEKCLPMCTQFFDMLSNVPFEIMTDKTIHKLLNDDSALNNATFRESIDKTVFERDTFPEEYVNVNPDT
jgi:hypothetical protein